MYTAYGAWVNVEIGIPESSLTDQVYFVDLTIFVSNDTSPKAGTTGTLGLALCPVHSHVGEGWYAASLMHKLFDKYGHPEQSIRIHTEQYENSDLYTGYVTFSKSGDYDGLSPAGNVNVNDQIDFS